MKQFVAKIVAAYLHKNPISPDDLPRLIAAVSQAFSDLVKPTSAKGTLPLPSVAIRRRVSVETITCLACGWSGSLLRSHLTRVHAITPAEYRTHWGLPRGHPMVAAGFSMRQSALSRSLGLGGWRNSAARPRRGSKQRRRTSEQTALREHVSLRRDVVDDGPAEAGGTVDKIDSTNAATTKALMRKRADLLFEIAQSEKHMGRLRLELVHLDAVLRMFRPEAVAAGMRVRQRRWRRSSPYFARGELYRRPVRPAPNSQRQSPASALHSSASAFATGDHFNSGHRTVSCTGASTVTCTGTSRRPSPDPSTQGGPQRTVTLKRCATRDLTPMPTPKPEPLYPPHDSATECAGGRG